MKLPKKRAKKCKIPTQNLSVLTKLFRTHIKYMDLMFNNYMFLCASYILTLSIILPEVSFFEPDTYSLLSIILFIKSLMATLLY